MMKRLLLLVTLFTAFTSGVVAQNLVSIIGASTPVGWTGDLDMTTTDGVTYTYSGLVITVPSVDPGVKFRLDHAWTTNWGANTFPSGVATQNGPNIPATNGTYDVTFNRVTGAYTFAPVGVTYDTVTLMGGGATYALNTADGVNYFYDGLTLPAGEYMFNINNQVMVGGTTFPSGTASEGININVPAGTYQVTWNNDTMMYNFGFPVISLIGSAIDGTWTTDIDLTTTDGITYTKWGVTLLDGGAKFRQSHAWTMSWGSADFPSGVATEGGADIAVVAGTYNITFNVMTGAYSFGPPVVSLIGSAIDANWSVDIDLETTDGVNYSKPAVVLNDGAIKFRLNHAWGVNWGSSAFPSGTATQDGNDIPVTAGTYDVTFNRTTGAFNFLIVAGTTSVTKDKVAAYPNPAVTAWNFSAGSTELTNIKLTDITGKTVVNQAVNGATATVSATGLANGVYFATVTAGGQNTVIRVVKN